MSFPDRTDLLILLLTAGCAGAIYLIAWFTLFAFGIAMQGAADGNYADITLGVGLLMVEAVAFTHLFKR